MWTSLPFELISDIFHICVDDHIIPPEILSHINHFLRDVAIHTPRLWSHIYYEGYEDMDRCNAFLERSATAPLTLDLNFSPASNNAEQLSSFTWAIAPHLPRVRDFRVAPHDSTTTFEDLTKSRKEPRAADAHALYGMFNNIMKFGIETPRNIGEIRPVNDSEVERFAVALSNIPDLRNLTFTTCCDVQRNYWSDHGRYLSIKLGALRALHLQGRSLGILTRLATPSIRSIRLDMIDEGAQISQFRYLRVWLQAHSQGLERIEISNMRSMLFTRPQAEDDLSPQSCMFPSLTHIHACSDPWTMTALLRLICAPALTEVFLGLHPSTERSSLIGFFESISPNLRTAHIGPGPLSMSGGNQRLDSTEQEYTVISPRIIFHDLVKFVSELYVGGAVIAASKSAPKLEFLTLAGSMDRHTWVEREPALPSAPFLHAPCLHTFVINGFSPACSSVDAPSLKHLRILAVRQHLSGDPPAPFETAALIRIITRFAASLEHLEMHQAIRGVSQTRPPLLLLDWEELMFPRLRTLFIMPYDEFIEKIVAPELQVLYLAQTSHSSPEWANLDGVSAATTLMLGSSFSDKESKSSLRWHSLPNINRLRVIINLEVRDPFGTILSLNKQIRRLQLLDGPLSTKITETTIESDFNPEDWLLPRLRHVEVHIASRQEVMAGAYDGVANGDPGYETDSSADGFYWPLDTDRSESEIYHELHEDYESSGSSEVWSEDLDKDLAEYYSNSSAWSQEDDSEHEAADNEPDGDGVSSGNDPADIASAGGDNITAVARQRAALEEYNKHIASGKPILPPVGGSMSLEPSSLHDLHIVDDPDRKSSAKPADPQLVNRDSHESMEWLGENYRGLGTYTMDEVDVDLLEVFMSRWPEGWLTHTKPNDFALRNTREAYGWIIHALSDVVRARVEGGGVVPLETITITASAPAFHSDESDWSVPRLMVDQFKHFGVVLEAPQDE